MSPEELDEIGHFAAPEAAVESSDTEPPPPERADEPEPPETNLLSADRAEELAREGVPEEHLIQLGLLARAMAGCGLLFVTAVPAADRHDIARLRRLVHPSDLLVVAVLDDVDDAPPADLRLPVGADLETNAQAIARTLVERDLIGDWSI